MLAGFDELDRLAKLESGALTLDEGDTDFAATIAGLTRQLGEVLGARNARFSADLGHEPWPIALSPHEAEALAWRLLATVTGAAGAGEVIALRIDQGGGAGRLSCALPASLALQEDVFASESRAGGGAVSAGMFGAGFALRLARAEARAIGGDLKREGTALVLSLPRLTLAGTARSHGEPGAALG